MDLLREIIKMKKALQQDEYIHIILPDSHGNYIGKNDKLIPYWTHNFFLIERKNSKTIIPLNKIIMVVITKEEKIYE